MTLPTEIEVRQDTMLRTARAARRGEDKCGQMEAQLHQAWCDDPAMDDDVLPPKTRPWGILAVLDPWAHKRVRLILPAGILTPAGDASKASNGQWYETSSPSRYGATSTCVDVSCILALAFGVDELATDQPNPLVGALRIHVRWPSLKARGAIVQLIPSQMRVSNVLTAHPYRAGCVNTATSYAPNVARPAKYNINEYQNYGNCNEQVPALTPLFQAAMTARTHEVTPCPGPSQYQAYELQVSHYWIQHNEHFAECASAALDSCWAAIIDSCWYMYIVRSEIVANGRRAYILRLEPDFGMQVGGCHARIRDAVQDATHSESEEHNEPPQSAEPLMERRIRLS
ncbi:hypothetical protein E4U43_007320 [Claviceps pusilla]|uniref:Uncharacterized protein n=1 Tax=Claviceps pusilla TaxID=123648 RepID=A0A9P7T1N8_9HYPO|nr:hypothetical protein E4U43_007320 [Claviceps pusilla]